MYKPQILYEPPSPGNVWAPPPLVSKLTSMIPQPYTTDPPPPQCKPFAIVLMYLLLCFQISVLKKNSLLIYEYFQNNVC